MSRKKASSLSPIRAIIREGCDLVPHVADGTSALKAKDRNTTLEEEVKGDFADSIDLDAALVDSYPQEHRWDYLLGHSESARVIGLEPHSAKNREISVVIDKRRFALEQLKTRLRDGRRVHAWYWVASGKVDFVPLEKASLRLQQAGIAFVGRKLKRKDLRELG